MRLASALCILLLGAQEPPLLPETVEFNRDIRPILADTCFKCHGKDAKDRKADLRLDTREGATAKLDEDRFAIVSGSSAMSEVWKRITTSDADDLMPPPKSGKTLNARQKALIRKWIDQGAGYQGHWAFLPPVRPAVPPARGRNEVDAFLQARLEAEGLKPSPEADRRTLARRLTLDLTGLPPTPEEVEAFVADASADSYERLVDRLLASPRYGEHMARYWLDLARYGDTHGLHLDNYREIWPYRDWVIRAFNRNLPFDRFVVEQLAGDLLPDATLDQQVASGFNRCHVTTNEGGSIEDEVYCRNVFDRVETFAQVFFALTFTCARCHDHKFDPFTQKDYYGLFAMFNSLDGSEMDGNRKDTPPTVKVPSPEQAAELARLRAALEPVEARMNGPHAELDAKQAGWEKALAARLAAQWTEIASAPAPDLEATLAEPAQALLLTVEGEGAFAFGALESKVRFREARVWAAGGAPVPALLDGKPDTAWSGDAKKKPVLVLLPAQPIPAGELKLRLVPKGETPQATLRLSATTDAGLLAGAAASTRGPWHLLGRFPAADGNAAWTTEHGPEKGVDLEKAYGELKWVRKDEYADGKDHLYPEGIGASFAYRTITAPSARKVTLTITSDDAVQAWLNGAVILARNVKRTFRKYDANKLTVELAAGENRLLLKFSNYGTSRDHKFSCEISDEEANDLLRETAAALGAEPRTDAQKALLRTRYRRDEWPEWRELAARRGDLKGQETALLDQVPVSLVFKEKAAPKDAFILKRGEYDKKGEKIGRATPATLPPLPKDLPINRLGVAKWLLLPEQPLMARVAVNRLWQQVFGVGLVRTSEDFGVQSEPPSHPELLDWLALRFRDDGWDVKRFMKRLVTSAAYRQSSKVSPELVRRDPENRLLARGPRYRMDAEMVRDQILFASGLLVEKLGGPSVKPPQPEGLWEAVGYTGSNTYRFSRDPEPEKVFRRSLYIFWKRTSAPPQMTVFDAPSREACIARRERTNTPLQALLLMNEPQCFEAARHLAQRAVREGGATPEERAGWMLRRVVLRPATPQDLADLTAVYRAQWEAFAKDPEAAKKAVTFGDLPPDPKIEAAELAAWTMVANLVFNLDEALNKR
jgi:hypothetical protein